MKAFTVLFTILYVVIFSALIVAGIIITPLLLLWSLNTLFPVLSIPYTVQTWAAAAVLIAFLHRNVTIRDKKKNHEN
jgi:hypothetical protein